LDVGPVVLVDKVAVAEQVEVRAALPVVLVAKGQLLDREAKRAREARLARATAANLLKLQVASTRV
jgi:hypothetical protein